MDEVGSGIEREYRKHRRSPLLMVFVLGLLSLNGFFRMWHDHTLPLWVPVSFAALYLVGIAKLALYMRRGRTLVGARGITARRAVTERGRAWHEIYDIRAEPVPNAARSARKWITYLYDTEGRRFVLPHMDDLQLDDPPTEVAALRRAAALHRGAAWERRPDVEALIRRRAGHRKAWERAVTGGLVALLCAFLLWVVLLCTTDHPPTLLLFLGLPLGTFAVLAALLHRRWESQVPAPGPAGPGAAGSSGAGPAGAPVA
ncbi:PH domain-containing protein [Streptomyces sp. NPDC020800]|uniref:PH domain-containing protein n=1 Tax=Streptomyces sp. NPDC020800 TaxID=3365092 RepID=UPI0037A3ECCF